MSVCAEVMAYMYISARSIRNSKLPNRSLYHFLVIMNRLHLRMSESFFSRYLAISHLGQVVHLTIRGEKKFKNQYLLKTYTMQNMLAFFYVMYLYLLTLVRYRISSIVMTRNGFK